jgi:transposase-like protein
VAENGREAPEAVTPDVEERRRIVGLERGNRELPRAREIQDSAAAFLRRISTADHPRPTHLPPDPS